MSFAKCLNVLCSITSMVVFFHNHAYASGLNLRSEMRDGCSDTVAILQLSQMENVAVRCIVLKCRSEICYRFSQPFSKVTNVYIKQVAKLPLRKQSNTHFLPSEVFELNVRRDEGNQSYPLRVSLFLEKESIKLEISEKNGYVTYSATLGLCSSIRNGYQECNDDVSSLVERCIMDGDVSLLLGLIPLPSNGILEGTGLAEVWRDAGNVFWGHNLLPVLNECDIRSEESVSDLNSRHPTDTHLRSLTRAGGGMRIVDVGDYYDDSGLSDVLSLAPDRLLIVESGKEKKLGVSNGYLLVINNGREKFSADLVPIPDSLLVDYLKQGEREDREYDVGESMRSLLNRILSVFVNGGLFEFTKNAEYHSSVRFLRKEHRK